jgi:hypothetical protein
MRKAVKKEEIFVKQFKNNHYEKQNNALPLYR